MITAAYSGSNSLACAFLNVVPCIVQMISIAKYKNIWNITSRAIFYYYISNLWSSQGRRCLVCMDAQTHSRFLRCESIAHPWLHTVGFYVTETYKSLVAFDHFQLKKITKTHKMELCWRCWPRNLSFICSAFRIHVFFVPASCNPMRHIEISWILQQSNASPHPPPHQRNAAQLHRALLQSCDTVSEPSNSLQSQRDLKEGNGACFKSDVHILSASPHLSNVDSQESPERKRLHGQKEISRLQWQTTTSSSPQNK